MEDSSTFHFSCHFLQILPICFLVVIIARAPSVASFGSPVPGIPAVGSRSANQIIAHALFSNSLISQGVSKDFQGTRTLQLDLPDSLAAGLKPRKRKSAGSLSRIYEGLMTGQKGKKQRSKFELNSHQPRYVMRSENRIRDYHTFPRTSSAEYLVSEFRRLFTIQPAPRRPYAMRLRWG